MSIRDRVLERPSLLACAVVTCRIVTGVLTDHVRWMRLRGMSPHTVRLRTLAVGLAERHAGKDAADLTEDDLDSWQGSLLVLADRTRATYAEQVKGFFRWAHEAGKLPADPSVILIVPRRPKAVPHPISEADLERALRSLPAMVRLWLVLAAFAGLRAAEIAGLRREDVREDAGMPHLLVRGKGGRERVVPLGPNPLAELLAFGLPARGRLFLRTDGRPVTGKYVSQTCNRWLHRLGIRETIHKGRHRFATQVLDHGAHIRDLQELLGHETLAATAVYTRVLPRRAAGVVAAVDHPLVEG